MERVIITDRERRCNEMEEAIIAGYMIVLDYLKVNL